MDPIEIPDGVVVVIYDRSSGAVRHVHEEVTLPGGTEPTREQIVANALAHARSPEGKPLDAATVRTLVVQPHELRAAGRFRVDPKAVKIVSVAPVRPIHLVPPKRK